ncbi:9443_t:CDS:2 [Diversispora eburnea]|uniref:9443_t:CDS:1 n=1 Tax=Diversispora eburnea TaxID=1213867 RepID=A0A9N9B9T4_9GLOM|nr:9443_t:CDS:2 [Diversispora eburnea]
MDPTVLEKLEEIHASCTEFMNNYQATFNLPTKFKTKRKNELKGELKLVLDDINNIHKFCKDDNSLKAAQEMLDPVRTMINKILKPKVIITCSPTISRAGSPSNSFATNFVRAVAATDSTQTNGAATNSVAKTSATSNKVRINITSRNSLRITIPAISSSINSINPATKKIRTDLNNNTSLGKRKSSRGRKKRKTN